jgi:hypothetical protein
MKIILGPEAVNESFSISWHHQSMSDIEVILREKNSQVKFLRTDRQIDWY